MAIVRRSLPFTVAISNGWLRPVITGLVFFALATGTILSSRFDGGVANIWLAGGLLLADLSTSPRGKWPATLAACAFASLAATSVFGLGPVLALPFALINLGEPLLVLLLLEAAGKQRCYTETVEAIGVFVLCAGFAAALTAIPAAALVHWRMGLGFWPQWYHWMTGHGLGMLIMAPFAALIFDRSLAKALALLNSARTLEAALHFLAVTVVAVLVFWQDRYPLLFLPILPLLVATFRFERAGAALSLLVLALVGAFATALHHGPFGLLHPSAGEVSLYFQIYMAVTVVTLLPVAAELRQRRQIFRRLVESEARYKLITESSTDIVLSTDLKGKIRYISPSIAEIGGYEPAALIGTDAFGLISAEDRDMLVRANRQALAAPEATFTAEFRGRTADGVDKWFESHSRALVVDGQVDGVVSAVRDISHRKSLEIQLAHAAATDPLTGLANRRAFDLLLERKFAETRGGQPAGCIAVFDIDHFKRVNDAFGHAIGDRVLQCFAECARQVVRATDHVARLGGEEFGIILDGADIIHAHRVCDRLRLAFADACIDTVKGQRMTVTVSAGIARIDPTISQLELMRAADEALYRAKAMGRNRLATAA